MYGSGFILFNDTIVTAAHVLYNKSDVYVCISTIEYCGNARINISKKQIKYHWDYKPLSSDHIDFDDIAKIILEVPLTFNKTVNRIDIVPEYYKYKYWSKINDTIYGYGLDTRDQSKLRNSKLKYMSGKECKRHIKLRKILFSDETKYMCLAFREKNFFRSKEYRILATHGDSGGPLVSNNMVIAITKAIANKHRNPLTILTPLAPYYSFLMGNRAENSVLKICVVYAVDKSHQKSVKIFIID